MTDKNGTDSKAKPHEKPSSFKVLLLRIVAIILLDFWIFGPVRELSKRKGPLFSVRLQTPPRVRRTKGRKANRKEDAMSLLKKKFLGMTVGLITGIAIIAIVAVTAYNMAAAAWHAKHPTPPPTA